MRPSREDADLGARVFCLDPEFMCAGELEAAGADDIWRQLQLEPPAAGRPLRSADVVYNEDRYYELNGDGGWVLLVPGPLTQHLYELAATADRGATS